MNRSIRILLAGGGTGGHLMPGIALYHTLRDHPDVETIHLLHTERAFDDQLLSDVSLPHSCLSPPEWPGVRPALVSFLPDLAGALRRYVQFFQQFGPDVVVGLGGFGCVPAGLTASLRGTPLVLMDQNVRPGRAVRVLHPLSDLFITQWEASKHHLRGDDGIRVLGNPIRPALKHPPSPSTSRDQLGISMEKRVLMVLGGSQGATPLNEWVLNQLNVLEEHGEQVAVIHISGSAHRDQVASAYSSSSLEHHVIGFTERIEQIYPAADLVLSRAGGTTLAELISLQKPSVLVPYPHATDNHQLLNAQATASTGGSIIVKQHEFSEDTFRKNVLQVMLDPERCNQMASDLDPLRRPNAAEHICEALLSTTR